MSGYVPTLTGFIAWVRTAMGISTGVLPDDSIWFVYAFNVSVAIVSTDLCAVNPLIYQLAVYNLGGDNLINYAQDTPPSMYFMDARASMKIASFTPGVVSAASDEATSDSLLNPEFMQMLTMANLQNLKTPWGRAYMGFAQSLGTLWGLS